MKFLDGVPQPYVLGRLRKAGGNELQSGKADSEESSASLAVNCFAWFNDRPERLPPLPGMAGPIQRVEVEYCARFPWRGGRHPWLDALVETDTQVIGVESKRYEPYRDAKTVSFSKKYGTQDWGEAMKPWVQMMDTLRSSPQRFEHLDAAQLVKHAFGLVTEGKRKGKSPLLVYLFAEPPKRGAVAIDPAVFAAHRVEIDRFAQAVAGAEVRFVALSYREWLDTWPVGPSPVAAHRAALAEAFHPW